MESVFSINIPAGVVLNNVPVLFKVAFKKYSCWFGNLELGEQLITGYRSFVKDEEETDFLWKWYNEKTPQEKSLKVIISAYSLQQSNGQVYLREMYHRRIKATLMKPEVKLDPQTNLTSEYIQIKVLEELELSCKNKKTYEILPFKYIEKCANHSRSFQYAVFRVMHMLTKEFKDDKEVLQVK